MPNNIVYIRYLGDSRLSIHQSKLRRCQSLMAISVRHPEISFITDRDAIEPESGTGRDCYYTIKYPWWCGECSATTLDDFLSVLRETSGEAELLLIYESGDLEGIRVAKGKASLHEVVCTLGAEIEEE